MVLRLAGDLRFADFRTTRLRDAAVLRRIVFRAVFLRVVLRAVVLRAVFLALRAVDLPAAAVLRIFRLRAVPAFLRVDLDFVGMLNSLQMDEREAARKAAPPLRDKPIPLTKPFFFE